MLLKYLKNVLLEVVMEAGGIYVYISSNMSLRSKGSSVTPKNTLKIKNLKIRIYKRNEFEFANCYLYCSCMELDDIPNILLKT